jgi:hypothetical protein
MVDPVVNITCKTCKRSFAELNNPFMLIITTSGGAHNRLLLAAVATRGRSDFFLYFGLLKKLRNEFGKYLF